MTKNARQILLGIIIGLLGMIVYLTPQGWSLEEKYGLHWLFQLRGPISAPNDVVVIAIDGESSSKLNLAVTPPDFWPWPRDTHAQLINRLNQAGAEVIVLDLIFRKTSLPEHDKLLAQAISDAGNVINVERLHIERLNLTDDHDGDVPWGLVKEKSIPLLPEISEAVLAHAPFPLPDTPRVDAYWTFKSGMGDAPTIPAVVLQAFTRHIHDDLIALLHKVHSFDSTQPPQYSDQTDNLESLIFFLRQLFINHPEIKHSLLTELSRNASLNAGQKHMIRVLINLYSGQEAYYLNFYGPPRTVKTMPYYQFFQPAANGKQLANTVLEQVKGKVVFVGVSPTTQSENELIRDAYHTFFTDPDGLKISGVEIAATAFANLLEDRPVKPLSFGESLALIVLMGLLLGYTFPLLPNIALLAVSMTVACVYTASAWLLFKQFNIWLPLVTPLLVVIPGAVAGSILLKYHMAKRERDQLLELFGQFTPERVVGDLTRRININLYKNQLVYGACLFTDIKGYTTLAEQMNIHQLKLLLDDYFKVLSRSVTQNDGVVTEKIGDAMLAVWEASTANKALREKACEAGLAIVDNINQFNRESGHPALPTRIGIHHGELLISKFGGRDNNYIYRVVGDLVNTTSRIESFNKHFGTHLLVSGDVIEGLDSFLTRPLGNFLFAGKSLPVNLSELIGYRETTSDKQRLLCAQFTDALLAYQLHQHNAIQLWEEILKMFPDDRPTRFYLDLCSQSTPDQWQSVIKLTEK